MRHRNLATLLLCLSALCPSLVAQTGPDLIVADMNSVAHFNPVGTQDAFAFSITTCNVGDQDATWDGSTGNHPVFQQRLYRLHDGRFVQIGRSSIRHGLVALSQNLCGGCSGGFGSTLPAGCSDTSSAFVVASQAGTGLVVDVDPTTGITAFPATDFDQTGNSVYQRLQVEKSELDATLFPGARYFVETQVVAADDAAAGLDRNNASWREVAITGGPNNYSASFNGMPPTERETPAISAWDAADPDVSIRVVNLSGEGQFFVAYRGTSLASGFWRYEVAVQNLNSARGLGGLSVLLPPGANPTNLEFNSLPYHSGEPYDGSPWTAATSATEVRWDSVDFATDPNASALRWGSLYNFSFVSDLAPGLADVELQLDFFAPGATASSSVTFGSPVTLSVVSGDGARANRGGDFDRDFVVSVTNVLGNPVVGEAIRFFGGPSLAFPGSGLVMTDANGEARIRASVDSTAVFGFRTVQAELVSSFDSVPVDFNDVYVRELRVIFPSAALVLVQFRTDLPMQPLILAGDDPSVLPTPTPFGVITTSILNPASTLVAFQGTPGGPYPFRAQLTTSGAGQTNFIQTGLTSLAGSGLSFNIQAYAVREVAGELDVWISNTEQITF